MSPSLELKSVTLRVDDLAQSLDFYVRQLGFHLQHNADGIARLAATNEAPEILVLQEDRNAPAAPANAAGLFHAALLFPNRQALSGWLRYAVKAGVRFDGFSDHRVSEAIYYSDPDGNGLEFYADRPRTDWAFAPDGQVAMSTEPLDLQSLMAETSEPTSEPLRGAAWGHLHLRVTNLERSAAFYSKALGMVVTQSSYPGARFLAADDYHHHVGLNTWGTPHLPHPPNALGLLEAIFARRDLKTDEQTRDPDGIALRLQRL